MTFISSGCNCPEDYTKEEAAAAFDFAVTCGLWASIEGGFKYYNMYQTARSMAAFKNDTHQMNNLEQGWDRGQELAMEVARSYKTFDQALDELALLIRAAKESPSAYGLTYGPGCEPGCGCGCNISKYRPPVVVCIDSICLALRYSPLVLDLNGDGVQTTGMDSDWWTMFDFDGDGVKNRTGWISSEDGFLVYDRNGDGTVNDGSEMFGDHTQKYDGSGRCADGYEALAQEDTNGDGLVNHLDDNWRHLAVWRDLNQNGLTDEGELFTLEELGITGFEVGQSGGNEELANGNLLQGQGVYYINGQTQTFSDAWFKQSSFFTEYPDLEIRADLADLPNLYGSGLAKPIMQAVCNRINMSVY